GGGFWNAEECGVDTKRLDANSALRITNTAKPNPPAAVALTWTSSPTRVYRIHSATEVSTPQPWPDYAGLLAPDSGATTTRILTFVPDPIRFYIIEAVKPLQ